MNKQLAILGIITLVYFNVINGANIEVEDENKETGELQVKEDQFRLLTSGKVETLDAVQIRGHQYSALDIDIKPIINIPQLLCRALYAKYKAIHGAFFQAWANKHCRPYIGCWCCPYSGLCITFIVRPNRLLCIKIIDIVLIPRIPIFEPQLQLQCS